MRIWDSLFFEGSKIFFRVALTLILQNKARFLVCKSFLSVTDLFKQIIKEPAAINCHDFMQVCLLKVVLLTHLPLYRRTTHD